MRTFVIALLLAAAVQGALGGRTLLRRKEPMGGPQDGRGPPDDGPGHHDEAWWNATKEALAECTSPMDLLEQEPESYSTLITLIKALNLTDMFSMPNFLNATRAPTEAFFTASPVPDLTTYNDTQLHQLSHAVRDLLFPDIESLLHRRGPGGPGGFPGGPGGFPGGPGGFPGGPGGFPGGPNDFDGKKQQGNAPQGSGPQDDGNNGPQGNGNAGTIPQGGRGGRALLDRNGRGDMDGSGNGKDAGMGMGMGPNGAGPNDGSAPHDGPGGPGPAGPWGPLPIGPDGEVTCPIAELIEVSTPVTGSTGCPLEACLPCAGLEGCKCVDCKCSCSVDVQL